MIRSSPRNEAGTVATRMPAYSFTLSETYWRHEMNEPCFTWPGAAA